jgi:pSer/pThr/pTyr-binding forkhead associated (FHA) protein
MRLQLSVLAAGDTRHLEVDVDRATIGKASENTIALSDDAAVSRLHAVFERFDSGWCVSDLGSSNGTWLNGERIWSQRRLREGDELRIGHTRILVRDAGGLGGAPTEIEASPPVLTHRERDVLLALCRPLLARDMFTAPASSRDIADELVVSAAAVKQHLANLYEKFGVPADDANRRVRLANEALRRGAVTLGDLATPPNGTA